jgi:hypothetical protein
VLFLILYGWVTLTYTLAASHRHSTLIVMLRFFAPFAFFTEEDSPGRVETWRGSPWFFLGWQLCLCAVAVIVALLRGRSRAADPAAPAAGRGACPGRALLYALAVVGGWAYPVISTPGAAPVPIAG